MELKKTTSIICIQATQTSTSQTLYSMASKSFKKLKQRFEEKVCDGKNLCSLGSSSVCNVNSRRSHLKINSECFFMVISSFVVDLPEKGFLGPLF